MSQNQNGISSVFFNPKLEQIFFSIELGTWDLVLEVEQLGSPLYAVVDGLGLVVDLDQGDADIVALVVDLLHPVEEVKVLEAIV